MSEPVFASVWEHARHLTATSRRAGSLAGMTLVPYSCLGLAMDAALGLAPHSCAQRIWRYLEKHPDWAVRQGSLRLLDADHARLLWEQRAGWVSPRRAETSPTIEAAIRALVVQNGSWQGEATALAVRLHKDFGFQATPGAVMAALRGAAHLPDLGIRVDLHPVGRSGRVEIRLSSSAGSERVTIPTKPGTQSNTPVSTGDCAPVQVPPTQSEPPSEPDPDPAPKSAAKLSLGAVVVLKSGGPLMTLGNPCRSGARVCNWFDKDGNLMSGYFFESQLREVPEEPKAP